jgi:Domain of Unknown Function (DUF1080)
MATTLTRTLAGMATGLWLLGSPLSHRLSAQQTYPTAITSDEPGFERIFDERTLNGWEGDPTYWRVENGALVGEVTPATLLKRNSFIVWRGGTVKDFELKLEFRVSAQGNSGVNYRSVDVPDTPWAMKGYQFDLDGPDRYTGNLYEERGRTFMALRGQVTHAVAGGGRLIVGSTGALAELQTFTKRDDWNEVHIIARGNMVVHLLNGRATSVLIDDDPDLRRMDGLLGVQVHVGPPMKVEYRNIRLKRLQ